LVELLHCYQERLRDQAERSHRHAFIAWALTAPYSKKPKKPPQLPAILKPDDNA
jgi:hypothetical protein